MKRLQDLPEWVETMNAMSVTKSPFAVDYVYYLHMLSQCKCYLTDRIETAAVCFKRDHYDLMINETFFAGLPIEQRLGILKHEMLHILYGHLTFQHQSQHEPKKWNLSTDCALNQHINRDHLPQGCILPDNFPTKHKAPLNLTSEQYYDLLEKDGDEGKMQQMMEGQGSGENGSGDHGSWADSEGDEQIAKDLAKNMAEKAAHNTSNSKSPGRLPSEYSKWIELLSTKREVDWKKVLRGIVGNKKAFQRKTILRRDRRSPHMDHIKGRTKDRVFNLLVVSDVSGSVSDDALIEVWNEITNISKTTNTPTTLIQIDTEAYPPEELKRNTRKMTRRASGGTYLSPALEKAKEHHIDYDAIVVTTDNELFNDDYDPFYATGKRLIWLIDSNGRDPLPEQNSGKSIAIKLKPKS